MTKVCACGGEPDAIHSSPDVYRVYFWWELSPCNYRCLVVIFALAAKAYSYIINFAVFFSSTPSDNIQQYNIRGYAARSSVVHWAVIYHRITGYISFCYYHNFCVESQILSCISGFAYLESATWRSNAQEESCVTVTVKHDLSITISITQSLPELHTLLSRGPIQLLM